MSIRRDRRALLTAISCSAVALALTFAGCSKTTTPPEGSTTSPARASSASPSTSASTAAPDPTIGPTVDLLNARVGTVLRSWPASAGGSQSVLLGSGWTAESGTAGPYTFVFELPTTATLEDVKVGLGQIDESSAKTLHLAASTTSATSGFNDIATLQLTQADTDSRLTASRARWIKLTVDQHGTATHWYELHV